MLLCHNVGLQYEQKQTKFDIIDNLGILYMNLFNVRIKNLNFKSSDNPPWGKQNRTYRYLDI